VDNPKNLKSILNILNSLATQYNKPVIVSTHPRTRKRIEALISSTNEQINPNIKFLKPFGFFDYINLQMNALCAVSDSGTISEESAILSFPAVSIRSSMERPEALDAGTIVLTGFNEQVVLDSIRIVIEEFSEKNNSQIPQEYLIENTSWRVLKLILGLSKLSNDWWGVNRR
jgi:UDP-N-acetylglucosamine 2-epimerase (non-hydrolysing)